MSKKHTTPSRPRSNLRGRLVQQRFLNNIYADRHCELSNDPPEDGSFQELSLCNIEQYRCGANDTGEIEVSYQYELFLHSNVTNRELVQEYLEEAMLELLADATETLECRRRKRRAQDNGNSSSPLDRVSGVNRAPPDVLDERFDSCASAPLPDTECVPMVGAMTVFFPTADEGDEGETAKMAFGLEQSVLDWVQQSMEDGDYVRPGSIEKVVFIENPRSPTDQTPGIVNSGTPPGGSSERVSALQRGIIVSASLLAFFILLTGLFLMRRRNDDNDDGHYKGRQYVVDVGDSESSESSTNGGALAAKDSLALKPQRLPQVTRTPRRRPAPATPPTAPGEEFDNTETSTPAAATPVRTTPELPTNKTPLSILRTPTIRSSPRTTSPPNDGAEDSPIIRRPQRLGAVAMLSPSQDEEEDEDIYEGLEDDDEDETTEGQLSLEEQELARHGLLPRIEDSQEVVSVDPSDIMALARALSDDFDVASDLTPRQMLQMQ